jgi:erythrin-vacuolar iron transport family protein
VLQIVQPGLACLMDGRSLPWPPLFAAAFPLSGQTLLVGLAAAIGAGISMSFAEALSDNGSLTGRGSPWCAAPSAA